MNYVQCQKATSVSRAVTSELWVCLRRGISGILLNKSCDRWRTAACLPGKGEYFILTATQHAQSGKAPRVQPGAARGRQQVRNGIDWRLLWEGDSPAAESSSSASMSRDREKTALIMWGRSRPVGPADQISTVVLQTSSRVVLWPKSPAIAGRYGVSRSKTQIYIFLVCYLYINDIQF